MKAWFACALLLLFVGACSSAPKNPGEVYDLRAQAEGQLDLGNKAADRGNYANALVLLDEARRLAVIADDPGLRIRTGLSRANALFAIGQRDEAADDWQTCLDEAEKLGDRELAALSRIHIARGRLLAAAQSAGGAASGGATGGGGASGGGAAGGGGASGGGATGGASGGAASIAQSVRDEVSREAGSLKDSLYTAFAWTVVGIAERELGRYAEAEAAVKRSLAIHERDLYIEQAAYDWFLIASIRSLSKNYDGARQAIEAAAAQDRRVENSWGLAADWRALGDIHTRAGSRDEARRAYLRSIEISRSLGDDEAADETERRMNGG